MSSRTQSPIAGACVFGTSDGFTMRGVGCLSAETPDLRRELDMQSYKVEREEAFWFSLPLWVDKVEARLIGSVSFAKDISDRDGYAGAAAVAYVNRIAKAGFSGAMRYAEDLHDRFRRSCVDPRSQVLSFHRASEALRPLAFLEASSARLLFAGKRPQRLKLPPAWPAYVSMPELFRLASSAEALKPADANGFVLREVDSALADIQVDERLLASWYDVLFGSDRNQRLERERDEARTAWRAEQLRGTELERAAEAREAKLRGAQATIESLTGTKQELEKELTRTSQASETKLRSAQATIESLRSTQGRFEADKQKYLSRIKEWERAYTDQEEDRQQLINELHAWHNAYDDISRSHPDAAARLDTIAQRKVPEVAPRSPVPRRASSHRPGTIVLAAIGLAFVLGLVAHPFLRPDDNPAPPSANACNLTPTIRDDLQTAARACTGDMSPSGQFCVEYERLLENTQAKVLKCHELQQAKQCRRQRDALAKEELRKVGSGPLRKRLDRILDCLDVD